MRGDIFTNPTITRHIRRRVFLRCSYRITSPLPKRGCCGGCIFRSNTPRRGVLRGLHFQKQFPQDKLVRAIRGEVFDVAVDLRKESPTFGKWYGVVLSEENKRQFFVPKNFAHGYLVLSDYAEFCYKCTDFYHPGDEGGVAWNDPEIGISWPIEKDMKLIISEKDQKWGSLKETFKFQEV